MAIAAIAGAVLFAFGKLGDSARVALLRSRSSVNRAPPFRTRNPSSLFVGFHLHRFAGRQSPLAVDEKRLDNADLAGFAISEMVPDVIFEVIMPLLRRAT